MNTVSIVMTIVGTVLTAVGILLAVFPPGRQRERERTAKETVELLIPAMIATMSKLLTELLHSTSVTDSVIRGRVTEAVQVSAATVLTQITGIAAGAQPPSSAKATGLVYPPEGRR